MDTDEDYLGDEIYVTMAGELPPDDIVEVMAERHRQRIEDPDSPIVGPDEYEARPARDTHAMNEDVPVDGFVTFYDPNLLASGDAFKHYSFPFRDHRKDEHPWFARPDAEKWSRNPVWKWQDPDADPHESLTLKPSLGIQGEEGILFHCWIRTGEIEWL